MKTYLYIWIEKYQKLNDGKSYLFDDFGANLSSLYKISHEWKNDVLSIKVDERLESSDGFYSKHIVDLKALVGNNGCGKTTLLTSLFQIIADGFGCPPNDFGRYALVFTENGKFFVKSSLDAEKLNLPQNTTLSNQREKHTSNFAVYYSTAFDDQEYRVDNIPVRSDLIGSCNISTNALLVNDQERVNVNSSLVDKEYPIKVDALHSYYLMEQKRKVDFLCDFAGKENFWHDLNLPGEIHLGINENDLRTAVFELVCMQIKSVDVSIFLFSNCLRDSKWGGSAEFPEDDSLAELIDFTIEKYMLFYRNLSFEDRFRFAAIMNSYRSLMDQDVIDPSKFCLAVFDKFFGQGIIDFPKSIAYDENDILVSQMMCDSLQKIARMLDYLKRGYLKNDNVVVFDLKILKNEFVNVIGQYNSIVKKSDFLSIGFSRALSSGESSMIKMYSRLYDALKKQQDGLQKEEIHFFLDEVDLYLHPEWQRQWLSRFIDGLEYISETLQRNFKFQVFFTTHSPFMLTDFLKENVLLLKRENPDSKTEVIEYQGENIFGSNIYDLIQSGFFLGNSVGCLFEMKIKQLLEDKSIGLNNLDSNRIYNSIGDSIIKGLVRDSIKNGKRK